MFALDHSYFTPKILVVRSDTLVITTGLISFAAPTVCAGPVGFLLLQKSTSAPPIRYPTHHRKRGVPGRKKSPVVDTSPRPHPSWSCRRPSFSVQPHVQTALVQDKYVPKVPNSLTPTAR